MGRKRLPLSDVTFACAFKVYSCFSGRRFSTDMKTAHKLGHVSKLPSYNSMFRYFEKPELTPIIQSLIVQSSLPLKAVEIDFAADSSGFSTSKLINWNETKYKGHGDMEHDWLKAHLMTGVKTNTVTAVEVWDRHTHDSFLFKFLVEATAKNFDMREVSADKGYLSARNLEAVTKFGATPYIPFKSNTVLREVPNSLWDRMFHYFSFNRTDFMSHYHKRSNVESTFSMIKGKFGDYVRSKTPTAQMNEVLLKVLCHNICVLIQATHELGIETQFRN